MTFAVMVIWFGYGHYAQFDTTRYNSMFECELAKKVLVERYTGIGSRITDDNIQCHEVTIPK